VGFGKVLHGTRTGRPKWALGGPLGLSERCRWSPAGAGGPQSIARSTESAETQAERLVINVDNDLSQVVIDDIDRAVEVTENLV